MRDLPEGIVAPGAPVLSSRVLALVRKMLNFAVDREWVEANVAAKMARPAAAEQSRTRVLTADEIRQVWKWLGRTAPDDMTRRIGSWRRLHSVGGEDPETVAGGGAGRWRAGGPREVGCEALGHRDEQGRGECSRSEEGA